MSILNFDDANIDHIYKELRRNLNEIKGRQYIGAASVSVAYAETDNAYDRISVLDPGEKAVFTISFTSINQAYAYASLSFKIYLDTVGSEVLPGDEDYPNLTIKQNVIDANAPNINSWTIELYNYSAVTHTYFLKFYVQSTDEGALS